MGPIKHRLRNRFGFRQDYPLEWHLERLRRSRDRWQSLAWSTPAQRKQAALDAARALERAAAAPKHLRSARLALRELERRFGGHLLTDEDGERDINPDDLTMVHPEHLLAVAQRIRQGAATIPDAPMRGRAQDRPRFWLVNQLHQIYRHGTDKEDRYSHVGGEYKGPFVDFAIEAGEVVGVMLTPKFIAETLDATRRDATRRR